MLGSKKEEKVRNLATANGEDLWKAVRLAKDLNHEHIPVDMTLNGIKIPHLWG